MTVTDRTIGGIFTHINTWPRTLTIRPWMPAQTKAMKETKTLYILLVAVLAAALPYTAEGIADCVSSTIPSSLNIPDVFDPSSTAMLCKASEYVARLDDLSFDATVHTRRSYAGEKKEVCDQYHFVFQSPNLFFMMMSLPDERLEVTADGNNVMFALDSLKAYRIQKQPEDLGVLVGWITQQPAFRRLFSRHLAEGWTNNVRKTKCVQDTIEGIPCDKLELLFERTDLTIWFRQGDAPIPIRLFADLSSTFKMDKGSYTTEIEWKNWNTSEKPSPGIFSLTVPEGFKSTESFDEAQESDRRGKDNRMQSLVGVQAPPFRLELLKGGEVSLLDHRGKRPIVLEFWATWCRPCKQALVAMEDEAKRLHGEDISFYAVNLMESRDEILPFVEKTGLKLPVAMDADGALAEQLHLEAVPSFVLIGRDGSIQALHVGYSRGFLRQIEVDLDALLQGNIVLERSAPPSEAQQLRYRLGLDSQSYCAVFVGY